MNWWTGLSSTVQPVFEVLGVSFYWYGLLIGVGVMSVIWVSEKKMGEEKLSFWISIGLGSLLGARIYHVMDEWNYYRAHLNEIWNLSNGGLGIFGAMIGGFAAIWIYSKIKKVELFKLTDKVILGLPLAQAVGRWGNFFNMEAFGPPTDLPWKIYIKPVLRPSDYLVNEYFHPLFLYESLLCLGLFIIMMKLIRKEGKSPGKLTGIYLIGYGIIRLIIESGRMDTWIFANIKTAQVLSLAVIILGLYLFLFIKKISTFKE